ncbi:alpha/beta-hydrolase [Aaosphaeria arxii CBS 175.79]|uniref:Alpha/beta-hydrolase n=1 Tax=Aaosphaeria arxii CBS 175.79 TaxID=1450172 RepID=A0A6A5Y949_9PLEO|nr:alpha/beta-hydrolase [Aaosphaeria arxii CBS 175.79]KAF2021776.1 alpha/beta-hydrolase [Aaosphaeria arxii CBS 175.79]
MPQLKPILKQSYYVLAGVGAIWASFLIALINPTIQRHALYAHKLHTGFWNNVSNPEEFGFAKGQVAPFHLQTSDDETLHCWHVLPMDVYLENEAELVQETVTGLVVEDLTKTVGYKLFKRDSKSKVVVNFHGNAGHLAQGYRPATYRSISGISHTHLITCDYRGFGISTLNNAPHIPTETGLITDAISMINYVLHTLKHPADRTVLLGQSLGTAVTAASALYFTDPTSVYLPSTLATTISPPAPKEPISFAAIILVAPFSNLPELLKTYNMAGIFPVLKPLQPYPRIARFLESKILDHWPTQDRLRALISSTKTPASTHIRIIHARNDQDIGYQTSEKLFTSLEKSFLGEENVISDHERRSIHGGDRVKRGAFAYRRVEDADGKRTVELEVVRYGGHNQVVGFAQVGLAVRRAFNVKTFRPGLDVE